MARPCRVRRSLGARLGLCALLCVLALRGGPAGSGLRPAAAAPAGAARTPAEVYERRARAGDAIAYAVGDLKARAGTPPAGDCALLLVVDATRSLANDLPGLGLALEDAFREGPAGLHVGVLAAGGDSTPPSMVRSRALGALEALARVPVEGPKNLLAEVRRGIGVLARTEVAGPKALLLVSEEGGDGEDDVEATRDALLEAGIAFYALAGEAAFERGWVLGEPARKDAAGTWVERFSPEVRKRELTLYFGGEVAWPLVPYRWEADLAATEFLWVAPPRYPLPSGFGYWPLASLAYTSGGRYFLHDFSAPQLPAGQSTRRTTLYDPSRLALVAPDLRPRARVLRDLARDGRARVVVRTWERLADEAVPLVGALGTLEAAGATLVARPVRALRSVAAPPAWHASEDDLQASRAWIAARVAVLEACLREWEQEDGRVREEVPGASPLLERLEADFLLLGVQLRCARFHLGELQAALDSVRPLDITQRRVRLVAEPIVLSPASPGLRRGIDLGEPARTRRLAELVMTMERLRSRFDQTPWSLLVEKAPLRTWRKDVQIVEDEPEARRPEPEPRPARGGTPPQAPKPPPTPPPPPPAGPRPGSGGGGPTTGG